MSLLCDRPPSTHVDIEHTAYLCDRSEASAIPTLLVAPPQAPKDLERDRSMYNDGTGDHRAIYEDGTWVAVDDEADEWDYDEDDEWSQYEEDIDPQAAYYRSLLKRYNTLRNTLASADPKELAAMVKADPDKYANVRVPYYKSDWRYAFDNSYPTPALVYQLDDKSLYRALEYVTEVLAMGDTISKQKSCWIWALLALVGDSGTLDYYKVGRIRELGHKAGQLNIRLRSGERRDAHRDQQDDDAEDWEVDGEGVDEEDGHDETEPGEESTPQTTAPEEQREGLEDGEVDEDEDGEDYEPPVGLGGQTDGASECQSSAQPPRPAKKGQEDEDMSMSEDEGEIQDDQPQPEDAPDDLEAARARLLAQLGDNLVKEEIPERKIPAHQLRKNQQAAGEARQGGRHRHNGKVCRDPACRMNKQRQEAHRKAAMRAAQGGRNHVDKPARSLDTAQDIRSGADQQQRAPSTKLSMVDDYDKPEIPRAQDATVTAQAGDSDMQPELTTGSSSSSRVNDPGVAFEPPMNAKESSSDSDSEEATGKEVDTNTSVTIDMILTVVGECYGQRDLLRFREVW